MKKRSERFQKFLERLHIKYRLVIMDHETLEEKFAIRLSRLNVFIIGATSSVVIVLLTTIIIAYTPLREYIPGYATVDVQRKIYELRLKSDSLEHVFQQNNLYIYNMKRILEGKEMVDYMPSDSVIKEEIAQSDSLSEEIDGSATSDENAFRKEAESQMKYFGNVKKAATTAPPTTSKVVQKADPLKNSFLVTPLRGYISNIYNPSTQHYGIDIVAAANSPIHSVLDGTVIFAEWTIKTGYTIAIQHANNIISVYKHNSFLSKHIGEHVKAGDIIAIIGNTGSQTTGTHLHFELWQNGISIDPRQLISL